MLRLFRSPCFSIFKANPLDFSHQNIYNSQVIQYAGVAELADAPDLGSGGNTVQVQVLSPAPEKSIDFVGAFFN